MLKMNGVTRSLVLCKRYETTGSIRLLGRTLQPNFWQDFHTEYLFFEDSSNTAHVV